MPATFQVLSGLSERWILQTPHFSLVPSVSPLREGHVLVVPKRHCQSVAQLPRRELDRDLPDFLGRALDLLHRRYGPVILFEHGVAAGKRGGCGVDHAHLHVVPCDDRALEAMLQEVERDFRALQTASMMTFLRRTRASESYLMIGRAGGPVRVRCTDVPSQYLRRTVARGLGVSEASWKTLSNWRAFSRTYDTLVAEKPAWPAR
jgi:diadenosine tetraphosphate (Ap4A) HIT family hydrolase